jgi:RNA polymerase sigma-70 factor, ECF subfamily
MSSVSGAQFEADRPTPPVSGSRPSSGQSPRAKPTEAELIARSRLGDRAAYGQIVVLHQDRLYNALLRLVGDPEEAGELTQEAFTRGLAKISEFRGEASPYTWLFRIGMNLGLGALRKTRQRRTFSLDEKGVDRASAAENNPADQAGRKEMNKLVLAALSRLEPDYRAILVMREIEDFDYQQMSEVLGLPLGTVKSRLFRARLALRDELHGYFDGQQ